jgi:uncharacterized protein (UPF0335 family)
MATGPVETTLVNSSPDVQQRIANYAERIDHLMDEQDTHRADIKALGKDISEVVAEAKGTGFDAKMIRKVAKELHRLRNVDKDDEEEAVLIWEMYWGAIRAILNP